MKAAVLTFIISVTAVLAAGQNRYEVWSIDQSNSPGKAYGGTLHIWNGQDLEKKPPAVSPEKIDLGGTVSAFCMSKTGANPVRPHMLAMNASQTHAIVSFVASGHVVFLNARTREPAECIRTSVGAGGARQVHFAIPSPDETYVAVANQNGKLFERINTNYATNTFVLDLAAGINLATCTTPQGVACEYPLRPDNAPICPIIDATSQFSFVTLRGGGLFVVDSKATPMKIVGEYDTTAVAGNGCLGAEVTGVKMYIDSGAGAVATNPHQADLYSFPTTGYSPLNFPNTPGRRLIFREEADPADAHGATLTSLQKYLWVADRGRNFIWVVDTATDLIVNRISLAGNVSADPTPDLLALSPDGNYVYMSLRGPTPLTADPHVSTGATPGVGIVKVTEGGRNGVFEALAPISNVDSGGIERADAHALSILSLPPASDITAQFTITSSALVYSRVTRHYSATINIVNNGGVTKGPLNLLLNNVPSGVTMVNQSGMSNGSPYVTVPNSAGGLAQHQSASVEVRFDNPPNKSITATLRVHSGPLN